MKWVGKNISQIILLAVISAVILKVLYSSDPKNMNIALGIALFGIPVALLYMLWHGFKVLTGAVTVERVGDSVEVTNHNFFFTLSVFGLKLSISALIAAFVMIGLNITPKI